MFAPVPTWRAFFLSVSVQLRYSRARATTSLVEDQDLNLIQSQYSYTNLKDLTEKYAEYTSHFKEGHLAQPPAESMPSVCPSEARLTRPDG